MKTYRNGDSARYGLYVSIWMPDARFVSSDGEPLEGHTGTKYVRIPSVFLALLAPVLGGVFVVAFPFLVFAAAVAAVTTLVVGKLRSASAKHAYLVRMGWEPSAAYLRKLERPTGSETVEQGEHELDELRDEVARRRGEEGKAE